jgi:adenylate kinase family enzyme
MFSYKKISIIGNTASGKSSLSVQLSKILGIPDFHLDKILWKPGWKRVSEEEFTKEHNKIIDLDSWIIEGVAYFSTMAKRLESADLIIYFDLDPEICKKRALKRMQEEKIRPNPFTNGCPYNESPENITGQNKVIDNFKQYQLNLNPLITSLINTKKIIFVRDEIETLELTKSILSIN